MDNIRTVADLRKAIKSAGDQKDGRRLLRLAKLFEEGGEQARPFRAPVRIRRNAGITEATKFDGEKALKLLNDIARRWRLINYERRTQRPGFSGPVIIAEGDSWFQYPIILRDIIDVLMVRTPIFCLSAAGDLLKEIIKDGELVKAATEKQPDIVLLSAGGNDLLDKANLNLVIETFKTGMGVPDLLNEKELKKSLDQITAMHRDLAKAVLSASRKAEMFIHGYDHGLPRPPGGRYLGRPLTGKGIPEAMQAPLIRLLLDKYNDRLKALADQISRLRYVDCRGRVGRLKIQWKDEIHPRRPGFRRVANAFIKELQL